MIDSQDSQGNVVEEGIFDMAVEEWMEAGQELFEERGDREQRHGPGNPEAVVRKR